MMKTKKEPWRIVVGILAIVFIIYTWVDKDTLAVLFVKWIINHFINLKK